MSTNCEHCGYRDNEVKSGTAVSEKGKRITLRCEDREDLSRDILKVCLQKIICAITDDSIYL
jgi:zinc finger protein